RRSRTPIWFQLFDKKGRPFHKHGATRAFVPTDAIVDDLRDAIKRKYPGFLADIVASSMKVATAEGGPHLVPDTPLAMYAAASSPTSPLRVTVPYTPDPVDSMTVVAVGEPLKTRRKSARKHGKTSPGDSSATSAAGASSGSVATTSGSSSGGLTGSGVEFPLGKDGKLEVWYELFGKNGKPWKGHQKTRLHLAPNNIVDGMLQSVQRDYPTLRYGIIAVSRAARTETPTAAGLEFGKIPLKITVPYTPGTIAEVNIISVGTRPDGATFRGGVMVSGGSQQPKVSRREIGSGAPPSTTVTETAPNASAPSAGAFASNLPIWYEVFDWDGKPYNGHVVTQLQVPTNEIRGSLKLAIKSKYPDFVGGIVSVVRLANNTPPADPGAPELNLVVNVPYTHGIVTDVTVIPVGKWPADKPAAGSAVAAVSGSTSAAPAPAG
ncbi:hypothetical protein HK405_015976, partial [Cladochytrium tenue]